MKLLFSLLLSGLILAPLSSFAVGAVAVRPGTKPVPRDTNTNSNRNLFLPNNGSSTGNTPLAFDRMPLTATQSCQGSCVTEATSFFSVADIANLNQVPRIQPEQVPRVAENKISSETCDVLVTQAVKIADHLGINQLPIEPVFNALSNALSLSVKEGWSAQTRRNLDNFIRGLTNGINTAEEGAKLQEVVGRCRT